MFRRNNAKMAAGSVAGTEMEGSTTSFSSNTDARLQEKAQDLMKDNLELMKDIVMKIREDPEFASNVYSNCPRLQHLLNQYPDLRPIFENPKLVRINFEQVYRDAGGVLPEDEEKNKKKSWLVWLVNSPFFKVLKLLLLVKKVVMCIVGGGFSFLTGCCLGCCCEDALEEMDGDADADADFDGNADLTQEALNKAAEHMEDPEVQEQMQRLLEDPENLQEAIENDDELRALRDSNPLCAELMSDPETMRVLTDPDNLRALGEAPSLIEADFVDPDSFTPDVDADVETADLDIAEGGDGDFDAGDDDADGDFDEANEDAEAEGDDAAKEDEEGWWDGAELEEQDMNDQTGDNDAANQGNARSQARSQARQEQESDSNGNGMRGIMASIGVAATEIIAAQIVGSIFGDDFLPGDLGGGGGGGDIEVAQGLDQVADDTENLINDDVAQVVEDTQEEVENTANESKNFQETNDLENETDDDGKWNAGAVAVGAAAGVVIVGGTAAVFASRGVNQGKGDEEIGDGFDDEEATEEIPKKKNTFFSAVSKLGSAVAMATKEHIATAVLGDGFGEDLVERMEKKGDKNQDDEEKGGDDKKGEDVEEGNSKRKGLFGSGQV